MAFSAVLTVTEEDLEHSPLLRKSDIGKCAIIVNGSWFTFDDKNTADNCYQTLARHDETVPEESA